MSAAAESLFQSIPYPSKWVLLAKYCEYSGETKEAVRQRIKKGQWLYGKHVKLKNRRLWVNRLEADRWVESE